MLADVLVGAIGFGAIGFLVAKLFTDLFAEKMFGGLVGFLVGLVIMVVVKATRKKRIK